MKSTVICQPQTDLELEEYLHLRWKLLRQPWNMPRGSELDTEEPEALKIMAKINNEIIGVGRIHQLEENLWQIRYMAVLPQYRGQHIGQRILDRLEELAFDNGAERIFLNSRESAVKFYQKAGYQIEAKGKTLFGSIKHYKMFRLLDKDL